MNKDETLALYAQGKDAWNAWAKAMLDERAEMEKAGTWVVSALGPGNEVTRAWMDRGRADFAGHTFDDGADFVAFVFPENAHLSESKFKKNLMCSLTEFNGVATFSSATFSGEADFYSAVFGKGAGFDSAVFNNNAIFFHATFGEGASFRRATFYKQALFGWAEFIDYAIFDDATFIADGCFGKSAFRGEARFNRTRFGRRTYFDSAQFNGLAEFDETSFESFTSFAGAEFRKGAGFAAAHCNRAFTLDGARFDEVPDFIQAHFEEAPRLDNVSIPEVGGIGRFLLPFLPSIEATKGTTARYRALKRLAIQAHDHLREQEYFASELKALRGHPDTLLPCLLNLLREDEKGNRLKFWPGGMRGSVRYWFGLFYEVLSDFGRSMTRPMVWLVLSTAGFTWAYLAARSVPSGAACLVGSGQPWIKALGLSIRKALPFAGVASSEKLNEIYACLYGIHGSAARAVDLPDRFTPVIPDAVYFLGIAQLLLSLLLIFLFLLAVRNHFRIR